MTPHDWEIYIPGSLAGYGMARCRRCGIPRETAGDWRRGYCGEPVETSSWLTPELLVVIILLALFVALHYAVS